MEFNDLQLTKSVDNSVTDTVGMACWVGIGAISHTTNGGQFCRLELLLWFKMCRGQQSRGHDTQDTQTSNSRSSKYWSHSSGMTSLKPFMNAVVCSPTPRWKNHWVIRLFNIHSHIYGPQYVVTFSKQQGVWPVLVNNTPPITSF